MFNQNFQQVLNYKPQKAMIIKKINFLQLTLLVIFFNACKQDHLPSNSIPPSGKKQTLTQPNSNAIQSSSENIDFLKNEINNALIDLNTRIIQASDSEIDSLEYYYNTGNNDRINNILGYTSEEAEARRIYLSNIAMQYAQHLNYEIPSNHTTVLTHSIFEKIKIIKDQEIYNPSVDVTNGGPTVTICNEPQFSICVTTAFFGGLVPGFQLLGALSAYYCYCSECKGYWPSKVCGSQSDRALPGGTSY